MKRPGDTKTYAAFIGAVLIGGGNFIAVTFSNRELPPLFGAALRFSLAAAIFLLLLMIQRIPLPRGRSLAGALLYGTLSFGVTYAGLYNALIGLSAATVSIVMAAVPLFTLLIAALVGQERLTARGVAGGLLTVVGIGVLSFGAIGGDLEIVYLLAVLVGALAAAASGVVARTHRAVHPVSMNAVGMTAGAALLAAGSLVMGEGWALPVESSSWWAVGWLVVLGSVGLFQLILYVIGRWTASAGSFAVSAMPVVAVALGAWLLDQPVTPAVVLGGVIVIGAVYVGALRGIRT